MAQGLRNRTTKLLGLVLSTVTNPIFARTISAIEEGAHELGLRPDPGPHPEQSRARGSLHPPPAVAARGRACLFFPFTGWRPTARHLRGFCCNAKPPPSSWATALPSAPVSTTWKPTICSGSYLMTRHLLELGHKKIAFLCGPTGAPWAQERLEGYRRALREADSSRTTASSSPPARPWRKAKKPPSKCCTRPPPSPPSRRQRSGGHGRGQCLFEPGLQNPRGPFRRRLWQHLDERTFPRPVDHHSASPSCASAPPPWKSCRSCCRGPSNPNPNAWPSNSIVRASTSAPRA